MAWQIKFANDFRPKQRYDVRTLREKKAGNDFFRNGSAAENVPAFERQHLLPRLGEVRRVHKPVVAATDNDDVVVLRHAE